MRKFTSFGNLTKTLVIFGVSAASAEAGLLAQLNPFAPDPTNSEVAFVAPEPLPTPTVSPYPDMPPWPEFQPAPAAPNSDKWNGANDPTGFGRSYVFNFNALPLSGKLEGAKIPWSDSYWTHKRGGIAYRWNAIDPRSFRYRAPSREQARAMTLAQLTALSPAEKYDLFLGNYSYPTVKAEWSRTSEKDALWEGICNGWTAASLLYPEPAPVTLANPDGILVPFGSSDIKAYLSYYYSVVSKPTNDNTRQVGNRCKIDLRAQPSKINTENCKDMNPATMHLVLANQLGLLKEGFAAEVDPGVEIWNQPVFGFESKILSQSTEIPANAAKGTVRRVLIETEMVYADESDPRMYPVVGTDEFKSATKTYRYWLDLGASGEILGGEWQSFMRPDFFWLRSRASFTGAWKPLEKIYRPNRQ